MILELFPRASLGSLRRRVVKRWTGELVLTDGSTLELWRVCRPCRGALSYDGKTYAYVRPLRARELWFPG
jgi:hypothetical protein